MGRESKGGDRKYYYRSGTIDDSPGNLRKQGKKGWMPMASTLDSADALE